MKSLRALRCVGEVNGIVSFFVVYKDPLVAVSWAIAGIGWLVSNRQGNNREKRKEARSEVENISKRAEDIVARCRKYYGAAATDPEDTGRSSEIAFEMQRLLSRVQRLRVGKPAFSAAVYASGEFFDLVTGGEFQSKARARFGADSELICEIEAGAFDLIDKLETGFGATFR